MAVAATVDCVALDVKAAGRGTAGVILVKPLGPVGICLLGADGAPGFWFSSKAAVTLTSSADGLDATGGVGAGAADDGTRGSEGISTGAGPGPLDKSAAPPMGVGLFSPWDAMALGDIPGVCRCC